MCLPSASRSRNFVVPSVGMSSRLDHGVSEGRQCEASCRAELAAEVAHQRDVGDAALVDPLEDLPAVETGLAQVGQRLFQLVQLDAGDVQSGVVDHGVPCEKANAHSPFYYGRADPPLGEPRNALVLPHHGFGSRASGKIQVPVLENGAASVIESPFWLLLQILLY